MKEHISILPKPSETLVYILLGILLFFNLMGIILAAFLKSIPRTEQSSLRQRVLSTLLLTKDPNLLLLIMPVSLIGIITGTFYASFAQVSHKLYIAYSFLRVILDYNYVRRKNINV